MKKQITKQTIVFLLAGLTGSVFAQGSLTPPGAPGATMKTLDQLNTAIAGVSNAVSQVSNRVAEVKTAVGLVETRTPISSAPFTISQSGSYYLTTNLTSTGHGVVIAASDVTLDLTGFTLSGDRGGSDYGVFLDGATSNAIRNVVVRNGIVRNFGYGVYAEYAQDSRFERLIIATNYQYGILLYGSYGQCDGNTIADCTLSGNRDSGIFFCGNYGQCDGNTLANCTLSGNGNYGSVVLSGYSGQCDGNTIADCTIRKNANYGINLYYADGNRVEGNHVTGQTGSPSYGVYCSSTAGNLIFRNTCVGQTTNFTITTNDTYGPIVTNTGALSGTDPWANFSR